MNSLPVELIEDVLNLLDFCDICNLRLLGRKLRDNVSQGCFRSFIHRDKRLHLTSHDLHLLLAVTERGEVGCCLEHVTLVGLVGYAKAPEPEALEKEEYEHEGIMDPEFIYLLTETFRNIKLNSESGRLSSLSLEVAGHVNGQTVAPIDFEIDFEDLHPLPLKYGHPRYRQTSTSLIWQTSSHTFQLAMEAMSLSQMPVDELRIYTDVLQCSLACNKVVRRKGSTSLWPAFVQTRSLKLSVSHNCHDRQETGPIDASDESPTASPILDPNSRMSGERNVRSIVSFLSKFPNLAELELHWYSMQDFRTPEGRLIEQNFLQKVVEALKWPALKVCTLKGFRTWTTPLITFFTRHPQLRSVTLVGIWFGRNAPARGIWCSHEDVLEDIRIRQASAVGQFRPILSYFARDDSKLEFLRLEEISESSPLAFGGSSICARRGDMARQQVEYIIDPRKTWVADNVRSRSGWADHKRKYGPAE